MPSLTSDYDDRLDFEVKFNHRLDDDVWQLSCEDLLNEEVPISHDNVRKFLALNRYHYRNISKFAESGAYLGLGIQDVMQAIKVRMYRTQMAEKKGQQLLRDVATQFSDKIHYNEAKGTVIVKGKLREYRIELMEGQSKRINVYNNATGKHFCIVERGYSEDGVVFDRVVTRALTLMNDETAAKYVHTI